MLRAEVERHVEFAVAQALAAPCVEIRHATVEALGDDTWRVSIGVANTGWLPTYVSEYAEKHDLVMPIIADLCVDASPVVMLDRPERQKVGQLAGSSSARFTGSTSATPDRASCSWVFRATAGARLTVSVAHQRAGSDHVELVLADDPATTASTDAS